MHTPHLTPKILHEAIITGCQSVVLGKEQLNEINIFPVADSDTGDNLASTAHAIIANARLTLHFNEMLQSVAEASLYGARGNSGIIFSQFFNGLTQVDHDKTAMDTQAFSKALLCAARSVRASLSSPVDGTMLTMIEDFASASSNFSQHTTCFNELMDTLLPVLKVCLNNTREKIPSLKKANVVDAGALGFYFFVEGFASLLAGRALVQNNYSKDLEHQGEHNHAMLETKPIHRYCTEAILKSDVIDTVRLTKVLQKHGDSLGVTGNEKMCRLHIHTNTPANFFATLMEQGNVMHPKVDDMLRQFEVLQMRKYDIALVTDSSADIPQIIRDEYQVHQIPLNIHIDDHHLLDRYCFEPNVFYKNLNTLKKHPKTSLASPFLLEEKLTFLSKHYKHVLVISIAKSMSGTFDAMTQVAKKLSNVCVIDSRTNSGAHGLLVQYAGELIREGRSFQSVIQCIEDAIMETSIFVMVNSLGAMVRSGRINKLAGKIGQLSGIKPIISIDKTGKGFHFSTALNRDHALSKMITLTQKMQSCPGKILERYCIVHAGVDEKAHDFSKRTTEAFQKAPAYIENVSPVIGLHAGYGCIALAMRITTGK